MTCRDLLLSDQYPSCAEETHSLSTSDEGAWTKMMMSVCQDIRRKPSVVLFIVATGHGNGYTPW